MSAPGRPPRQYYAVPQSPGTLTQSSSPYTQRKPPPPTSSSQHSHKTRRGEMAHNVATGAIGSGYGPYSYNPRENGVSNNHSRFSTAPSETSSSSVPPELAPGLTINSASVPPYLWDTKDPDLDDALHNPDPVRDAALDRSFTVFSVRGWINMSAIVILLAGLITLFAGYPIISQFTLAANNQAAFNTVNSTGQINKLPNFPSLIDDKTPTSALTYKGTDGQTYSLVFSDEFETPGRTFYPGDDPYWEAVDLHYWPTGDLEWYDPAQITTENGKLVITMEEKQNHNLNFVSGMLQSWNKFCFTTGYIEVSVSLPGTPNAPGFWPGIWTMGNLGRAGYGATTEGVWPYSYATCDLGTFKNQTATDGTPAAAATGGANGGPLSYLPGQRLSACTCPGSDHPGPNVATGRNAPEIDIIEAQVDVNLFQGQASQSFQTAPYNYQYQAATTSPDTVIKNSAITQLNSYQGSVYQQAVSAVSYISNGNTYYNNTQYTTYGFEFWSDPNNRGSGYISWFSQGAQTWTMNAAAVGPDPISKVQQRLIPEEPMYIIFNFGMAPSFQQQDFMHLQFPSKMYIDYVRVYQRSDAPGIGCDPSNRPTANYIQSHLNAYSNPNLTTWAQAGYQFPRNSLYNGC